MKPSDHPRRDFLERYGAVYEHSPWVAEAVWPQAERGALDDPATLQLAMRDVVDSAAEDKKLALLRAHPELAGKAAIAGELGPASKAEQSGAGLDQCSPEEFAEFQSLNGAYNAKFGFPFIIAVKGLYRRQILQEFRRRLENDPREEFHAALAQVHKIAGFRLAALVPDDGGLSRLAKDYLNLAQPRLGCEVVAVTDDFFADASRLIDPDEPVFIPGKYDAHGKWMDGWESRRKRVPGHDWLILRLGSEGRIAGFEIDTRHFTGNYPPQASIEACNCADSLPPENQIWTTLVDVTNLEGNSRKLVAAAHDGIWTHVRLNIFPDGGVARLRVYGRVAVEWSARDPEDVVDLLAMENGGRGIVANDEHFGKVENLTAPGRGADMADGWETRRRRIPGHDWAVLELGAPGEIEEVVVDTAHFKGNYPDRCSVQVSYDDEGLVDGLEERSWAWPVLLPEVKLQPDHVHSFREEVNRLGSVKYVRLNIFPDGGVSRLRLFGKVTRPDE